MVLRLLVDGIDYVRTKLLHGAKARLIPSGQYIHTYTHISVQHSTYYTMADRILDLMERMQVSNEQVKEGKATLGAVGVDEARAREQLRNKMEGLKLLFDKDGNVPSGKYVAPHLTRLFR